MPMAFLNVHNKNSNTRKGGVIDLSNNDKELVELEIVAEIIHKLKTKYGEEKITLKSVHIILKEVLELVEDIRCNGRDKKKHVITIMTTLINDLVGDENERIVLISIIENKILENMIDLIVGASRGKININKGKHKENLVNLIAGLLDSLYKLGKCICH